MVAEVTVVGAGIIALASTVALAERGTSVRLLGTTHRGEASTASAGMLTPTVEDELHELEVYDFAIASRDLYPEYVTMLEERTGIQVPLNRAGALRIATSEQHGDALRSRVREDREHWLSRADVTALEPALKGNFGAIFSPHDGCVDPILLMDALRVFVAQHPNIEIVSENACSIDVSSDTCEVATDRAGRYASDQVVLAAGAWTPTIEYSGTSIPVEPVRGQMIAYAVSPLRHVTYGPHGYLVPKADGHTLAGSTFERVGFNHATTDDGLAQVRSIGEEICLTLKEAPIAASWAGLRPVTPDLLPVIGPDPAAPNVILACGHARNGILLAPLTAQAVADFVTKTSSPGLSSALDRFRPERF